MSAPSARGCRQKGTIGMFIGLRHMVTEQRVKWATGVTMTKSHLSVTICPKIIDQADLPFTRDGVVPDIIFNSRPDARRGRRACARMASPRE